MDILNVSNVTCNRIFMADGTHKPATLPDMMQLVQDGNSVLRGLDVALDALQHLYNLKNNNLSRLRDNIHIAEIVCGRHNTQGASTAIKRYDDAVAVLEGVQHSMTDLEVVRTHIADIVTKCKFWLNQNGVII